MTECLSGHTTDTDPIELDSGRRETPYFEVDRDQLATNVDLIRKCIGGDGVFYAVKANPEPAVLERLVALGVGFEVASVHEMDLLWELGVEPERILYGTAVKSSGHIGLAYRNGVRLFSADSAAELTKIAGSAPGSRVFVRVRVDDTGSVFAFGEKFGAEPNDAVALLRQARSLGLHAEGISFHVGSQSTRATAWAAALRAVAPILEAAHDAGIMMQFVNIGGGFPCQYAAVDPVPSIATIAGHIDAVRGLLGDVQLVAEPGRFIAASAAKLVVSVIARSDRGGDPWLFVDAGCYNGLFEAMTFQGHTRYPVRVDGRASGRLRAFNIAGPTGDSADVVARGVWLPESVGEGSRLVFDNVGAYTMSMSVPFNGFPKPAVHVR